MIDEGVGAGELNERIVGDGMKLKNLMGEAVVGEDGGGLCHDHRERENDHEGNGDDNVGECQLG